MSVPADFRPSVDDLGGIMRDRTYVGGVELGTFTDETNPTAEQAERMIDSALGLVAPRLGDVRTDLLDMARAIVSLRAAMLVESGLFTRDSGGLDGSAFAGYREQYRDALVDYDAAVNRDVGQAPTAARVASVPMGFLAQASLQTP